MAVAPVLFVLRPPTSDIEPIGSSNSTVPKTRIFYGALLVAKVGIDQPVALGITLRPLEIVKKGPGMKGANSSSVGDRAGQLREHFAIPLDSAPIRYATMFFFIGGIEITASTLGDFDDRVVVLRRMGEGARACVSGRTPFRLCGIATSLTPRRGGSRAGSGIAGFSRPESGSRYRIRTWPCARSRHGTLLLPRPVPRFPPAARG